MNQQRIWAIATAASCLLSASLLVACGGAGGEATATSTGSGQQTAAATGARLTTYITDNLATEYSQVWVGVMKITAVNSTGAEVTLYSTDTAAIYNISSLASVSELMSSAAIPAGVYRQIRVTLADAVKLVSLDGATTITTAFTGDGSTRTLRVDVTLDTATDDTLVLDFDLARFTYSTTTQLVTPTIMRKDSSTLKQFKHHQGEVHGSVVSTDATANTVTVNDPRLGATTLISLTSDAVITRAGTGAVLTLADLSVGMRIEARGVVTSASSAAVVSVQASALRVESADGAASAGSSAATAGKLRGEGTVTAVNGSLVTLRLSDASFLPTSASISLDVSSAKYVHGQATDMVVGASLEFRGALDTAQSTASTTVIQAGLIDIAGAASAKERKDESEHGRGPGTVGQGRLAKLTGTVSTISGSTWTITVAAADRGVAAGTYTVDTSAALSKAGTGCVAVGSTVEVRGNLSGSSLSAKVIELTSACAASTH